MQKAEGRKNQLLRRAVYCILLTAFSGSGFRKRESAYREFA